MADIIKQNNELKPGADLDAIYNDIREHIIAARETMCQQINTTMLSLYWYIGRVASNISNVSHQELYGKNVINTLSIKLSQEFGNGFSPVSLRRMRKFYELYQDWNKLPKTLTWAHFQELTRIDRREEREFYEEECIKENWGYRELHRQINTKLYDRYLVSPHKDLIMEKSRENIIARQPEELLKTPYIFEFAGLKENRDYLETDLEKALLNHLTEFLLELGRGFSFVASQPRIKIGEEYFYPDLVFYNRLARCFVIIDLKIGKLTHQDLGQMQMYVNYYKKTQMVEGENNPIGIVLCAENDRAVVEMTLGDDVKNVYASKYLTYLPSKEELQKIILEEKEKIELGEQAGNEMDG